MLLKWVFNVLVVLLSITSWAEPFASKSIVKSAPLANLCKSFYYSGLAVLDGQNSLVRQIERAHLKYLGDFRRAYYHYENYRSSLTKAKRQAILAYKGTSYGMVNKFLRTGESSLVGKDLDTLKQVIKDVDDSIDDAPQIPRDIVLFRGIGSTSNSFGKAVVGDVVEDKAFTSTSLSIRTALNFANNAINLGSPGILQVIHVKRDNMRGLYIEGQTFEFESEILIDRGSKYRVLRTQHVVLENKVNIFDSDDLPTVIGSPVIGNDPVLFPPTQTFPSTVIEEPVFTQLELFKPEELPVVIGLPGQPVYPSSPGVDPGILGGPVFPSNGARPTHLIIQHLELIQDRDQ
tara:strand:- start:11803 stop:12843 length:1041 start_codon:yes stop_codon:yes gene_type:complete